jgi:SAM-dependent methyltransferase
VPWPFEADRFDAVVATPVLEHVEALGPVFREARRVLRDGGTFYRAELHSYRQFGSTQGHFEDEATGDEKPRLLTIRFGADPHATSSQHRAAREQCARTRPSWLRDTSGLGAVQGVPL